MFRIPHSQGQDQVRNVILCSRTPNVLEDSNSSMENFKQPQDYISLHEKDVGTYQMLILYNKISHIP